MATTNLTIPDQVNVITLKCAKEWHNAFKEQNKKLGFNKGDFPNSIVIPFADIEQIVTDFRDIVHENVNGVRIYFIIKPGGTASGRPKVSCICVPTTGPHLNVKDVEPNKRYADMIVNATLRSGAPENPDCRPIGNSGSSRSAKFAVSTAGVDDSGDGYVTIYDVTQPCPPFCDPNSL